DCEGLLVIAEAREVKRGCVRVVGGRRAREHRSERLRGVDVRDQGVAVVTRPDLDRERLSGRDVDLSRRIALTVGCPLPGAGEVVDGLDRLDRHVCPYLTIGRPRT